jgi:DNA-binding MltR family transcriptional regulator
MVKRLTKAELIETLYQLSERADASHVLVTVTALEELLELALLYKMRELSNNVYDNLFQGYGPLSSFSAKIDIAYALSIIGNALISDFRALKDIRNAFAHPREAIHFKSAQLAKKFQKLSGWHKDADRRQLFDERMAACFSHLDKHNETAIFISALQGHAAKRSRAKS